MAKITKTKKQEKIFVLDTSVILYNHNAMLTFEEHDVAIPITVLEELDNFKKGNDIINYEAREFIRFLDYISKEKTINEWLPLDKEKKSRFKVIMNGHSGVDACKVFGEDKPDHRILNVAISLSEEFPQKKVVLVSKDINLRLKAKALNICAEDYQTGKIKDVETLYTGKTTIENANKYAIDSLYKEGFCMPSELELDNLTPNHYFIIKNDSQSVLAYYNPIENILERVDKKPAHRIVPRNAEQVFALHAITNPNIKLVTLQGVAGTGKTLLALAGALEQKREYKQIYLARPIVPLSNKDIGFYLEISKAKLHHSWNHCMIT
jgi:PhoH-like ATPase